MAKKINKPKRQPPNEKIEALKKSRQGWERYSHRKDDITKAFAVALRKALPVTDEELAQSNVTIKIKADESNGYYGTIKVATTMHGIENKLSYDLYDNSFRGSVEGAMTLSTTQLVEWLTHHLNQLMRQAKAVQPTK